MGLPRPRAAGEQQELRLGEGCGAPQGPPPLLALSARVAGDPWGLALLPQLLLNPPLQLLAAGPAACPILAGGCRVAQVQGQGPHLLKVPALVSGARRRAKAASTASRLVPPCQPRRTFIHPFVCLQGQGMGEWGAGKVRSRAIPMNCPMALLSFFTEASQGPAPPPPLKTPSKLSCIPA